MNLCDLLMREEIHLSFYILRGILRISPVGMAFALVFGY